jgi:hypothetical protein
MNRFNFDSPFLSELIVDVPIYENRQILDIFIRSGISTEKADKIIEIFKNAHVDIESYIGYITDFSIRLIDKTKAQGYVRIPASQSREALSALFKAEVISAEERCKLQSVIVKCEERVPFRDKICEEILISQEGLFKEMFVDMYLESLREKIETLESMRGCLILIFSMSFAYAKEYTFENEGNQLFRRNKIRVDKEFRQEVWESICALQKLFHGEANLESTFLRISGTIPSLKLQREIMTKAIKKMVFEKFKVPEDDKFWKEPLFHM